MLALNFSNGTYLKYIDLSDQLTTDMIINSTESNPPKITINEIGDEINEALFDNSGKIPYLKEFNPNIKFNGFSGEQNVISDNFGIVNVDQGVQHYIYFDGVFTHKSFWLHTANGNSKEDGYNLNGPCGPFTRYRNESNWNGYYFWKSNGGYTYLCRFKTNRVDIDGNIISDYGFGVIASQWPLEKTTYNAKVNGRFSNHLSERGWININTTVWTDYRDIGYNGQFNGDINDLRNATTRDYTGYVGIFTGGTSDTYIDNINTTDNIVKNLLAIEGAIQASTTEVPPEPVKEVSGPVIGATDSGMVAIYATPATKGTNKMQDLAKTMWTTDLVSSLKQSLFNTADAIISMSLLPVDLSTATTTTGEPAISDEVPVVLNGVTVGGITMNRVDNQYLRFSWPAEYIEGIYKSYLDRTPYTTASIYLPYSGSYEINIDEFMDHYMKLVMIVDIFTGQLRYEIYTVYNESDTQDKWVLQYTFTGNMTYSIPITSGGWGEMWSRFVTGSAAALM